jgi:hypothetical protein
MSEVYVVHWLAKEVSGDYVTSMIEYVTTSRTKAEEYVRIHQQQEQVMNIDGRMCEIRRQIVPAVLEQEYKP